jgi:hypothetical protein
MVDVLMNIQDNYVSTAEVECEVNGGGIGENTAILS